MRTLWRWLVVAVMMFCLSGFSAQNVKFSGYLEDSYSADWRLWPVLPKEISAEMRDLYLLGIADGNDPHRFSKIGDCQNVPSYFLGKFDDGGYHFGEDQKYLEETISWFSGSWNRFPPSVHGGQNVVAVQISNPIIRFSNNGQDQCLSEESYLDCELRLWKPSMAIVSFEELWNGDTTKYSNYYDQLIVKLLNHRVVPMLATTAANEPANDVIAELAKKYHLPVWNVWAGLQPLKNHGIADGFHLTRNGDGFDFSSGLNSGWQVRNLTALQAIDALRNELEN